MGIVVAAAADVFENGELVRRVAAEQSQAQILGKRPVRRRYAHACDEICSMPSSFDARQWHLHRRELCQPLPQRLPQLSVRSYLHDFPNVRMLHKDLSMMMTETTTQALLCRCG